MKINLTRDRQFDWKVEKIAVIGPGIVGMPMAALLAKARIKIGSEEPAKVVVIQRNSLNSGWKVEAINSGRSVIGGIEPGLGTIVEKEVAEGILSASHDYQNLADADVILVCIQTDKKENSFEPDYRPMFGGLTTLAKALQQKPPGKIPLIIFESTLAPSTMDTLFRDHFASYGLVEGEDILLGNSPNRVMPGRLVERVTESDKLVAGLHPETPRMIRAIYQNIVKAGELHLTNSMSAEVTKTLENAYRDVRIAYSSEIVRYCDEHDIDFYVVRDKVNEKLAQTDTASKDPNAVPSGGILVPMIGVGGHCLPKDGILLLWRKMESSSDVSNSLILKSREINNASPAESIKLAERKFGALAGKKIAVLGAAYRFNSEDTRNSPGIVLAKQLQEKGCQVVIHDPFVKPDDQNLIKFEVDSIFTNTVEAAVKDADILFFGTAHKSYHENIKSILLEAKQVSGLFDGCNLFVQEEVEALGCSYTGIGRGKELPSDDFIQFVYEGFLAMEKGLANEVNALIGFLNDHYAKDEFNRVQFETVQALAASCNTGCVIVDSGPISTSATYRGFTSALVECARRQYELVAG